MVRRFEARITLARLPLSPQAVRALRKLEQYDLIVFTSKNARRFFMQALRECRISLPKKSRIVQVGPRTDLLKLPVKNKRILFPRSAIAPYDIVRQLRARGASVRVIPLYTARGAALSRATAATAASTRCSSAPSAIIVAALCALYGTITENLSQCSRIIETSLHGTIVSPPAL